MVSEIKNLQFVALEKFVAVGYSLARLLVNLPQNNILRYAALQIFGEHKIDM